MPALRNTPETAADAEKKIVVVAAIMTPRLTMKMRRKMRTMSHLPLKDRIDPHRPRSPKRKCRFNRNPKLYEIDGMLDMIV